MEMPTEVLIHNELLGLKGGRATLLQVGPEGYYEVNVRFGDNLHRVLLPIATTVLINKEPEAATVTQIEVER